MRKIDIIKISPNTLVKEALRIISKGKIQIALVVDKNSKLLGTLTDGDIRNGLLKGLSLDNSIKSIYFKKPTVVTEKVSKKELLKIAISKKINQIPVIDKNKKIIAIHVIDELLEPELKSNKIIIMAGGKGMRLRPLTNEIPKPMLKIGNKPILQILIERFRDNGFKNFIICVNYKSKVITDFFGNGTKYDVNIEYIKEKQRMGTAGALSLIKKKPKEPFFVINGDLITNLNFNKMLDFHKKNKSQATMCISEYNITSPYGEVKMKNFKIKSIEEKPTRTVFVNTGVYILDPKCLIHIPKKFYDMTTFFKKIINKKFKTISFPLGEYWIDIGRLNDFKKANNEFNSVF